jgi:hypothetical protein
MQVTTVAELQTAPYVDGKPRQEVKRFVSISQCEDNKFYEKRGDSALIGVLLQIRHSSISIDDRKPLLTSASRYAPGASINSRQRLGGGNKNYDRFALFADTQEKGRCFAIILKNATMASQFFHRCIRYHEGVGNVLFLDQPTPVTTSLGSTLSVPIVDWVWDTIPLSNPIKTLVPDVTIKAPDMGCTRYFCTHNATDVRIYNATFVESICQGYFCDRQLSRDNFTSPSNVRCGCFQVDRNSTSLIIQFDVKITCPPEFDQSESTCISNFRSYRTSMLFLTKDTLKFAKKSDSTHLTLLRKAVDDIVEYVNQNGGWSYIGWLRTGIVHDISETQNAIAENLASTSQSPHLSYLFPTNVLCIAEDKQEYLNKKMIINTEEVQGDNVVAIV